jgi:aerobic carbon-monoxide dehydrogenase medium subunit
MPKYSPVFLDRPATLSDAVSILKKYGTSARPVAGNTTMFELANQGGLVGVEGLVDIMGLGLSYIRHDENASILRVGATTSFTEIGSSEVPNSKSYYAIKEVSLKITPPQIRNMGTIGGALCSGIPFYDMPTVVVALDSKIRVSSHAGERIIDSKDFFVDYFITALSPEELVLEVQIPDLPRTGSSFVKLGRSAVDFAVVNVSARVTLDDSKRRVKEARVALGAVSNCPIRHVAAEEYLTGKEITDESILSAAKQPINFDPTPSFHARVEYKKKVIPVVVRDALLAAVGRAEHN